MEGRLFEDLVVSAPPAAPGRRAAVLPLSMAAHGAALAVALLVPVLRPGELPTPPERPIVGWTVPLTPTPPPPMATPPPPRVKDAPASRVSAPAAPSEPTAPAHAPGPTVSMIEPEGLPAIEGPAPCLVNCDAPGPRDGGDGPRGGPTGVPEGPGMGPIRVSDGIKPPVRTTYVVPIYPEIARPAGISATVVLECTIDPTGHVADVRVIAGHPLFNEAALTAVRQWRYSATRLNGVPVALLMTVTVRFIAHR